MSTVDKSSLMNIYDEYFKDNLNLIKSYSNKLMINYENAYIKFSYKSTTIYIKFLKKIERYHISTLKSIYYDRAVKIINLENLNLITLCDIFNIDIKYKDDIIKFLESLNILTIPADYVTNDVGVCTWPKLSIIIANISKLSNIAKINEEILKFYKYCFNKYDLIIKEFIYRIVFEQQLTRNISHREDGY